MEKWLPRRRPHQLPAAVRPAVAAQARLLWRSQPAPLSVSRRPCVGGGLYLVLPSDVCLISPQLLLFTPQILPRRLTRSEEHTSELQSRGHLVCRLLLAKNITACTKYC